LPDTFDRGLYSSLFITMVEINNSS